MRDTYKYVPGNFGAERIIAFQPGTHYTIIIWVKNKCVISAHAWCGANISVPAWKVLYHNYMVQIKFPYSPHMLAVRVEHGSPMVTNFTKCGECFFNTQGQGSFQLVSTTSSFLRSL